MKIKKIIFILLFCFLFSNYTKTNDIVYASVFGDSGNESSNLNGNTSEKDIIKNAKGEGENSKQKVAKFKNSDQLNASLDKLNDFFRWLIIVISSTSTVTSFVILGVAFFRLSTVPSHPIERRKVIIDILQSGIVTILSGGITLVMTLFYKTFSTFINNSIYLTTDYKTAFAMALIDYKYFICGIMGILCLSMLIVFIKDILSLASSGGNPQQRMQAIKGLFTTIVAIMGFGGVGIFVAIFNTLL